MSDPKHFNPLDRLWHASLLILGTSVVLWIAVQLLATIWGWLLIFILLAAALAVAVVLLRARRNRW